MLEFWLILKHKPDWAILEAIVSDSYDFSFFLSSEYVGQGLDVAIRIQHAPVCVIFCLIQYFVKKQVWCNIDHLMRLVLFIQSSEWVVHSNVWVRECNLVEVLFFASFVAQFYYLPLSSVNWCDDRIAHYRCFCIRAHLQLLLEKRIVWLDLAHLLS